MGGRSTRRTYYYSYTTDGGRGAPVRVRVKLFSFSPRKSKESCQEVSFGLLAASLPIGTVEGATLLSEAAQIGGRRSNRREKKKKILSIEITRTFRQRGGGKSLPIHRCYFIPPLLLSPSSIFFPSLRRSQQRVSYERGQ